MDKKDGKLFATLRNTIVNQEYAPRRILEAFYNFIKTEIAGFLMNVLGTMLINLFTSSLGLLCLAGPVIEKLGMGASIWHRNHKNYKKALSNGKAEKTAKSHYRKDLWNDTIHIIGDDILLHDPFYILLIAVFLRANVHPGLAAVFAWGGATVVAAIISAVKMNLFDKAMSWLRYKRMYSQNIDALFDRDADAKLAMRQGYSSTQFNQQMEKRIYFKTEKNYTEAIDQLLKAAAKHGFTPHNSTRQTQVNHYYDTKNNMQLYNNNTALRICEASPGTNKMQIYKLYFDSAQQGDDKGNKTRTRERVLFTDAGARGIILDKEGAVMDTLKPARMYPFFAGEKSFPKGIEALQKTFRIETTFDIQEFKDHDNQFDLMSEVFTVDSVDGQLGPIHSIEIKLKKGRFEEIAFLDDVLEAKSKSTDQAILATDQSKYSVVVGMLGINAKSQSF